MLIAIGLLILFALLALPDLPKLIRNRRKQKRELYVYLGVFSLALVLSELHVLGVDVPSANRLISDLVRSIT